MRNRYPSLQALRSFLQVAETESVTRAAKRLALTHSAVSQHIATLEAYVDRKLLVRNPRGVALNHAGRALADSLAENLDSIDHTLALLRSQDKPDTMTLTVGSELAQGWLNSRLPQLQKRLSCKHLTVLSTNTASEMQARASSGITLCYGYGEWSDREVSLICNDTVVAVASPALLEQHQVTFPAEPKDISRLPALGYTKRSWQLWLGDAGLPPIEPPAVATFDNVANLLMAAEAGLGVGLSRRLLVVDRIRSKRLQLLCKHSIPTQYNLYATWPHHLAERAKPVVEAIQKLARESLSATA